MLAAELGFDETDQGKAALVVTEAASNLVKHAGGGELIVQGLDYGQAGPCLEILALDSGRGMSDVGRCLADGYSTAGSPGTGLGAISRLADSFEIYSGPGTGTVLWARLDAKPRAPSIVAMHELELGVVRVAAPGEQVCGDDWAMVERDGLSFVLMVDGLGHGPSGGPGGGRGRARFPGTSVAGTGRDRRVDPPRHSWHARGGPGDRPARPGQGRGPLRRRGQYLRRHPRHGRPAKPRAWSRITAPSGTRFARSKPIDYPWTEDSLLLMHSDGLATHWNLDRYPGICARGTRA